MSWCDYDSPQFYNESFPRARKQHACCECRAPILIGERHLYWRGKWDDGFSSGRQHMICRDACMAISNIDDCIPFGGLKEWWDEFRIDTDKGEKYFFARKYYAQVLWRERSPMRLPLQS